MLNEYDVIIIGAGPAGLFTACNIKRKRVLVLEKKQLPGRKLLLTGSGQCNLTHDGNINNFLSRYGDNGRFLKHALYLFSNKSLLHFFEIRGMHFELGDEGKYFPSSRFAGDVLDILLHECGKKRVTLSTCNRATAVEKVPDGFVVTAENGVYTAKCLVLACGGKSYPVTGSTGDGYGLSLDLGHSVVEPREALTPVYVADYFFGDLAGISFPHAGLSIVNGRFKGKKMQGPLLLTHQGLSGPVVLHMSRYINRRDRLLVNFSGFDNRDYFRECIHDKIKANPRVSIKNIMKINGVPAAFIEKMLGTLGVDTLINCSEVSKKKIDILIDTMMAYEVTVSGKGNFDVAMATAGGIDISEIDSRTFSSKKVDNLYFAGEIIDVDGDSGGYNLQACFSTAYCVANTINRFNG